MLRGGADVSPVVIYELEFSFELDFIDVEVLGKD